MKTKEALNELINLYHQQERDASKYECRRALSPHEFLEFWEAAEQHCQASRPDAVIDKIAIDHLAECLFKYLMAKHEKDSHPDWTAAEQAMKRQREQEALDAIFASPQTQPDGKNALKCGKCGVYCNKTASDGITYPYGHVCQTCYRELQPVTLPGKTSTEVQIDREKDCQEFNERIGKIENSIIRPIIDAHWNLILDKAEAGGDG